MRNRIEIFCGGFGSGKTEIVLNQAAFGKELGEEVVIMDLDTINPYFRSRDFAQVPVIAPKDATRELTPAILKALKDRKGLLLVDLGGSQEGALVLGSLSPSMKGYCLNFVFNPYRPFTGDVPGSSLLLKQIEVASKLKVTHIIGNINLGKETTISHIKKGYPMLKELASRFSLPIKYLALKEDLISQAKDLFEEELFPLKPFLSIYSSNYSSFKGGD